MPTVVKTNLQRGVSIVNRFIPLRPTIPVLGNVYFGVEKGEIILRVTNLETSIEVKIPAKTDTAWETTIPAKLLTEFLSTVGGTELEIETEKESVVLNTDQTKVTIATISATEFPKPPFSERGKEESKFKTSETYQTAAKIAFAASLDEGKPVLNSIYLKKEEGGLALVATDGYRLAKQLLPTSADTDELLVPARTFVEALKVANELEEEAVVVTSDKNTNQLLVVGENFQVATRLVNGVYPNYKQIIPSKFVTSIDVNREELTAAVKTVAVFARDLGNVVTFNITDKKKVILSATTLQVGEGSTQLGAEVSGESIKVSFNSHYFSDGLAALKSETVKVAFSGELSPALISAKEDPNFSYIVMPVKSQK